MQLRKVIPLLFLSLWLNACGGGGASDSPDQGSEQPQLPTEPVELPPEETLLNSVNIEDLSTEMNAASFGLESWKPRALQVYADVLYIAEATSLKILRYDLKNKKVLAPLSLIANSSTGRAVEWKDLRDIFIDQNRLYVATGIDQRIDIFQLQGASAEFIMSLGTGNTGNNHAWLGLTYPTAVVANQDYIFVADQQNQIHVWQKNKINSQQDRSATKYTRFNLPNCTRGCHVRLEIVGQQLFAGVNNAQSYVYDIKNLTAAPDANFAVDASKSAANTATAFHVSIADQLLYSAQASGRIQMFKLDDVAKANAILPSVQFDAVSQYRLAGQSSQQLATALDVATYKDMIFSLSEQKLIGLAVRKIHHKRQDKTAAVKKLSESAASSQQRMLQNGESWSVLTNRNERHVYMNQILSASFDRQGIRLQSYSAVPVHNLQIRAKLRRSEQWILLAELDQLTPFSRIQLPFSLNSNTYFNLVDGSGSVRLDGVDDFDEIPANLFEQVQIHSLTDTHVQKLNKIKAKWKIFFGTYDEPNKWCRITPVYAREWVIMMSNLAYILSTPEFETLWFNHKAVMGHDFFGNAGKVNGPNGFYSAEDYRRVYQEILNRGDINLGITNMGGGLGGGSVLGVDTWLFYGHYRLSGFRIIAHEFGHHWGGHGSAWAMEGHGFEAMVDWLNFYFQRRKGSLPYMDPNVNAFHLTPDAELCQGVNQNMVRGVATSAPWNKVDEYFKNNPMPNN